MRAVVWNREWDDDYDDLSSFAPKARLVREPLPAPPLPANSHWRTVDRNTPHSSRRSTALAFSIGTLICLGLLATTWFLRSLLEPLDIAVIGGLLAVGAIACAWEAIIYWKDGNTAHQEIRWLARDAGVEDAYPVRVTIRQNGDITGNDDGVAFFNRDALHFKGLQCEFTIGAQDLRFDPHMIHSSRGWIERGFVIPTISLRHPDRTISIAFEPYARLSKRDERDCAYRFRKDLRMFLHNWRQSHEPSLYPPLAVRPDIALIHRNRAMIATADPTKH